MPDVTVLSTPLLGHVEGVELIDTGSWNASSGPFTPTSGDLIAAVAALDCPAVRRPVLKAGHVEPFGQGDPALGYVANLRTANEGHTLVGDYRGMPGWLTATDADGQSVLASAYPDRSIEGEYGYRCQLGHTHPFVVHAVAILGVERPAVGTLQSLQELYGVVAATEASPGGQLVTLTHSQEAPVPIQVSAAATTDDVRRAYYAGPGSDWDLWIREMYVDPPELIVDNDQDGSILRVPYATAADGTVTFADPQRVKVTYVAARAGAGVRLETFASRAESRPGDRPAAAEQVAPVAAPPAAPAAPVVSAVPMPTNPPTETAPPAPPAVTPPAVQGDPITTPPPADPPAPQTPADPGNTPNPEEETGMADLKEGLRSRLGLQEDVSDDDYLAAVDEALSERADPVAASTGYTPPAGFVLVPQVAAEQQQRAIADGVKAATGAYAAERERVLAGATREGRIFPDKKSQEAWAASYDANPAGIRQYLASSPQVVPVETLGYTGGADENPDDALDRALFGETAKVGG